MRRKGRDARKNKRERSLGSWTESGERSKEATNQLGCVDNDLPIANWMPVGQGAESISSEGIFALFEKMLLSEILLFRNEWFMIVPDEPLV